MREKRFTELMQGAEARVNYRRRHVHDLLTISLRIAYMTNQVVKARYHQIDTREKFVF
jgi:hypothetical protein